MCTSVSIGLDGTSTLKSLEKLKCGVGGRLKIGGIDELTSPSTVRGGADERKLLRVADFHVVHRGDIVDAGPELAWVI